MLLESRTDPGLNIPPGFRRKRQVSGPDGDPDNSDYNPRIGKLIEAEESEFRISCRFLNPSESRWPASLSMLHRYQAVVNDIIVIR
jgi:hypothetical protein